MKVYLLKAYNLTTKNAKEMGIVRMNTREKIAPHPHHAVASPCCSFMLSCISHHFISSKRGSFWKSIIVLLIIIPELLKIEMDFPLQILLHNKYEVLFEI
jgi:hypothetical protein